MVGFDLLIMCVVFVFVLLYSHVVEMDLGDGRFGLT